MVANQILSAVLPNQALQPTPLAFGSRFPRSLRSLGAAEHRRWASARASSAKSKRFQAVSGQVVMKQQCSASVLVGRRGALTRGSVIAKLSAGNRTVDPQRPNMQFQRTVLALRARPAAELRR